MVEAQQASSSAPAPQKNRRRFKSHLVNHDVRLRLVLDDVVFALIAALAAIGILYWLSNRELGENLWSAHMSIKETRELLNNGVKIAGLVTFAAVLLFGLWSLVDAHRIAGPMHRLHRLLHEIAGGNLTHEIRFRKRDEFHEIAEAADELVDVYATRIEELQVQAAALRQGLEGAPLTPGDLERLSRQAMNIENALAFFRCPDGGAAPTVDNRPIT